MRDVKTNPITSHFDCSETWELFNLFSLTIAVLIDLVCFVSFTNSHIPPIHSKCTHRLKVKQYPIKSLALDQFREQFDHLYNPVNRNSTQIYRLKSLCLGIFSAEKDAISLVWHYILKAKLDWCMCHGGKQQEPTLQENKAYSTKGLSDKQKEPELNIRTYQVHILAVVAICKRDKRKS